MESILRPCVFGNVNLRNPKRLCPLKDMGYVVVDGFPMGP